MSLYIVLDPLITNQQYKAHAVFFMAAMAFSTTLINGTTARYVLEGLGMVNMTPQQLEVLEYVLKVCALDRMVGAVVTVCGLDRVHDICG
jgi:hypothetical protein